MSVVTRHLLLILLLQFHGVDGFRPNLSLIPRPDSTRSPERAVVPLALRDRQRIQLQIDSLARSPCVHSIQSVPSAEPWPRVAVPVLPVQSGSDLRFTLMSLLC